MVSPFFFLPSSPPCPLPHSFLSPVHASGIPLDPLNEGHIAGLAERGEWERRRGVTKEISVRGREREAAGIYRSGLS